MPGSVYVLTNPSMPGLVKIGRTTGPVVARGKQLFTTGVPSPFQVVGVCLCEDPAQVENTVHDIFNGQRHHKKREFFQVHPSQVAATLRLMGEVVGFDQDAGHWEVFSMKSPLPKRLNIKTPKSVWRVMPEGVLELWGVEVMRAAIEAGADPDEELYGNFPLTIAIYQQKLQHVQALLECGACVNNVREGGGDLDPWPRLGESPTPLVAAIKMGDRNLVVDLIHRGADVNLRSWGEGFPLAVALGKGNDKIIEVLMACGAMTD